MPCLSGSGHSSYLLYFYDLQFILLTILGFVHGLEYPTADMLEVDTQLDEQGDELSKCWELNKKLSMDLQEVRIKLQTKGQELDSADEMIKQLLESHDEQFVKYGHELA